jgi:hypothetical protein
VILEARLDIRVVFTDIQMPGSMDGLKLAGGDQGPVASAADVIARPRLGRHVLVLSSFHFDPPRTLEPDQFPPPVRAIFRSKLL